MKKLLYILLFVFMCSCSTLKETNLVFVNGVGDLLYNISNNYHTEVVVCLKYRKGVLGDIIIYDYYLPVTLKSNNIGISYTQCPADFNAIWHNHPLSATKRLDVQYFFVKQLGHTIHNAKELTYMSGVDIKNNISAKYDFSIVSSKKYYAWWTYDQYKDHGGERILQPVNGQRGTFE